MNDRLQRILTLSEGEKFDYDASRTWVDLFLTRASESPDSIAVEAEDGVFTYRQLEEASGRVAGYLLSRGLKPDQFVAVRMRRGKAFMAAVLGIHRAGGAYVPIDPDYPAERVAYMLDDCGADIIMTEETTALALETGEPLPTESRRTVPDGLAYMIYTSGSTGKPKGVMIQHKALLNFVHFIRDRWHLTAESRIACHSSFAFDASVEDLYPVLTAGGTLVIVPEEIRKDIFEMQAFLRDRHITGGCYSTRFGQLLAADQTLDLSYICLGGEAMTAVPRVTGSVYNTYGPTEFTVDATYFELEKGKEYNPIPIGRPLYNCAAFILGEHQELLPPGETGELCLAGPQLALGYWKWPELTAEKFTDLRIADGDIRKIYRTGDLARYNEEGQLEFCGRMDSQVKLRGFRIELGEVESAALRYPGILQAAAEVKKDTLCLYYSAREEIDEGALKGFMARTLTDYMLPGWFGRLERMPETPNGKLDRKALPEPSLKRAGTYTPPETAAEQAVALCMQKTLGTEEEIGKTDDFLDMGGDSIKALRLISFLRDQGLTIKFGDVLKYRTVEAIAAACGRVSPEEETSEEPMEGMVEDSAIFLYYRYLDYPNPAYFNQSTLLEWKGRAEPDALRKALDALCRQHDLLRACLRDGHLYVNGAEAGSVRIEEYAPETDEKEEIVRCCEEIQSHLIPDRALVRAAVLHTPARDLFFLTAHHTVVDGISWRILLDDLETAYGQALAGQPVTLPKKTCTYREYARAQQEYRDSYALSLEIPYWQKTEKKLLSMETSMNRDYTRRFGHLTVSMDEQGTAGLLAARLSAYGLEINDLLLAALGRSWHAVFGKDSLSVQMEGHGREPLGRELLTDRTVGWFTSIYPVVLEGIGTDARSDLIRVKETLRRIPGKGAGYNILACMEGKEPLSFEKDRTAMIVFNYLGNVAGEGRPGKYFAPDSRDGFAAGLDYQAKENCDGADLTINCLIDEGRFRLWLDYNPARYEEDTARRFAEGILREIVVLAGHLASARREITASDLGETAWSEEEFEAVTADFASRGEHLQRIYPLTPLQEGMLLSHLSDPSSPAYRLVDIYALDYLPSENALRRALDALAAKHEVLRTAILYEGVSVPRQAITDRMPGLIMADLSGEADPLAAAKRIRRDLLRDGFDLQKKPLFSIVCARVSDSSCYLITAVHHIIVDGWCVDTYLKDFELFLQEAEKTPGPIEVSTAQDGKFEAAVRELLLRDRKAAVACFRQVLEGYDGRTEIPAHLPIRPEEQSPENEISRRVSPETVKALEVVCREAGATLAEGISLCWGLVLTTACRTEDVVFHRVVSGRDKNSFDVTDLVAPFINSVPTRLKTDRDATGADLLREIHRQCTETSEYDFCPLADLKKAMNTAEDPASTLISVENYFADSEAGSLLKPVLVKEEPLEGIAADVMTRPDGGMDIVLSFRPEQYRLPEMERVLSLMVQYMTVIARSPDRPVSALPLLNREEEQAVIALSQGETLAYDPAETWVDLVRRQVSLRPDAPAVEDARSAMTYRELDEASGRIAAWLLERQAGGFVALRMGRVKEFVAAVLGILKAGLAYVPIDLDYPAERVEYILSDSGAGIVLTEELVREILAEEPSSPAPDSLAAPEKPAYMIYTSGSTGRPKGVVIQHRAMVNLMHFIRHLYSLTEKSRIACHSNFAFDASVEDLYSVLIAGGTTLIVPEEARKDTGEMRRFIREHHVNGGSYSTRFGQLLAEKEPLEVNYLCVGGEAMTSVPLATGPVFNAYGPTEFTVDATMFRLEKGREYNPIPIGRPVGNCAGYIVDPSNRLLPRGMAGELCMAGLQMARGYWNRPELTAEKFTDLRLTDRETVKVYHTGDLARYNEEDQLEYIGRIDFQVKLRGFRIELGEIENCAERHPQIIHAVATVKKNTLCLYYTSEAPVEEESLKAFMAETLADYMVPSCWIRMEAMPMTASGKINRGKLPDPVFSTRTAAYQAPTTDAERKLCAAMETVLELEENTVGIHDDFFELGGDSLKAMMVMSAAGLEGLNARMVFRFKTPARIAEALSSLKARDMGAFEEESRRMRIPAHRGQIMMIDDQFGAVYTCMFNLTSLYRFGRKTDAEKLARAVDAAVQQHPALCSAFDFDEDGNIVLAVTPGFPGKTEVQDVTPEEIEPLSRSLQQPFTLFRKPLFRSRVLRCVEETYLFLDMHHTVSDGTSIGVLLGDIARAWAGQELSRDYFYSYLRREHEARGTAAFREAMRYFSTLLEGTKWCGIPTPDFETISPDCAYEDREGVLTTAQMAEAEKRTGFSRNVIAITTVILAMREFCGRDEICVDYINNNRTEAYLQSTVGLVFKTLPIAVDLNRYPDLHHLLREVNRQVIDSFVHSICDYRAEVISPEEDYITVNYVAELGSAENMTGLEAEELPAGTPDDTMAGHGDLYFEEADGLVTLHLEYLQHAYREENIRAFMDLVEKYLRQIVLPEAPESGS